METMTIKERINARYHELSPVCKKVARFVTDNYQQSMLLSSSELAEVSNTSHTAVIRFAKALGFSGFIEYKNELRKEYIATQKVYYSLESMKPDSSGSFLNDYFSVVKNELEAFISEFDTSVLDDFCEALLNADTVYIMGIGSDEIVTDFLSNYLNVVGIKTIPVYHEGLSLRERLFLISEKDVLFLSSFPTTVQDEYWAASYARKQGAKVLVLTDSEITARNLGADCYALVQEHSQTFFNSYILPMLFCNTLLLHLYESEREKIKTSVKSYSEMLNAE